MALRQVMEGALAVAFDTALIADAVIATTISQARALWHLRENISEAPAPEGSASSMTCPFR